MNLLWKKVTRIVSWIFGSFYKVIGLMRVKFLISFISAIFWPKITSSVKKYFITLRPRSTHVIKQGSRGLNRSRPQEKIRSRKSGRLMLRVPLEVKPLLFSTSCLIYQTNQNYPTSSTNHFSLKMHNSMKIIRKT